MKVAHRRRALGMRARFTILQPGDDAGADHQHETDAATPRRETVPRQREPRRVPEARASRGDGLLIEKAPQVVGEVRHRAVALIRRDAQRLAHDGVEIAGEVAAQARRRRLRARHGGGVVDGRLARARQRAAAHGARALRPARRGTPAPRYGSAAASAARAAPRRANTHR